MKTKILLGFVCAGTLITGCSTNSKNGSANHRVPAQAIMLDLPNPYSDEIAVTTLPAAEVKKEITQDLAGSEIFFLGDDVVYANPQKGSQYNLAVGRTFAIRDEGKWIKVLRINYGNAIYGWVPREEVDLSKVNTDAGPLIAAHILSLNERYEQAFECITSSGGKVGPASRKCAADKRSKSKYNIFKR